MSTKKLVGAVATAAAIAFAIAPVTSTLANAQNANEVVSHGKDHNGCKSHNGCKAHNGCNGHKDHKGHHGHKGHHDHKHTGATTQTAPAAE